MDENKDIEKEILDLAGVSEIEMTERQKKILDASIQIFAKKGFEAARTSDIAKEAEVAEGTIFRYYKTKKDLLMGLLLPITTKFFKPVVMNSVENIIDSDKDCKIDELLKDIFLDRVKLARKNLPLIKTVLVEALYHPELLNPLREKVMPQILSVIDGLFNEQIENETIANVSPRFLSRTSMSLLAGYIILTAVYPDSFPVEDEEMEAEKIVDVLLHGILNKGAEKNE